MPGRYGKQEASLIGCGPAVPTSRSAANDHQWRGLLGLAIWRLVSYAGGMRYPCDVRSHVKSESVGYGGWLMPVT